MFRRAATLLLAPLLLLGLLAACADEADRDPLGGPATSTGDRASDDAPESVDDGTDADRPEVLVELLDPGAEPRRPLRLDPPEDCEQPVTMRNVLEQRVSAEGDEQAGTTGFEYDVTYRCTAVGADRIEVLVHYDDARVEDADPVARDSLEEMMENLVGADGRTVYDRRGRILEADAPRVSIDDDLLGEQFADAMDQMLDSMESSIDQSAAPFPEEPVGVGARWRTTGSMDFGGMDARLVSEFTLTELGAERVVAATVMTMEITPGPFEMEGVPGSAEIVSGGFSGTGTAVWAAGGVVAEVDQLMDGETVIRLDGRDGPFELVQAIHQTTSVHPR